MAQHATILRIDPLFAAGHALAARGEHLPSILFPNLESLDLVVEGKRAVFGQFIGSRIVGLRMFDLSVFDGAAEGMAAS